MDDLVQRHLLVADVLGLVFVLEVRERRVWVVIFILVVLLMVRNALEILLQANERGVVGFLPAATDERPVVVPVSPPLEGFDRVFHRVGPTLPNGVITPAVANIPAYLRVHELGPDVPSFPPHEAPYRRHR